MDENFRVFNETDQESELSELERLEAVNYVAVLIYFFMFFVGAPANLYVAHNLATRRKTRHETLLFNLAIADALVTVIIIPVEIVWRINALWKAGNLMCKAFKFLSVFPIYLSSMVLICISVDRLLAVYSPFKYQTCDESVKKMLMLAWIFSTLFSIPQILMFKVISHEKYSQFIQCMNIVFLNDENKSKIYNIFCITLIYFLPLAVISICYIWICIRLKSKAPRHNSAVESQVTEISLPGQTEKRQEVGPFRFSKRRRDEMKNKIVKDTLVIILAFIICWTPYATIHLWYQIDKVSISYLSNSIQEILFIFALSNSCVNPYIYGKILPLRCFLEL